MELFLIILGAGLSAAIIFMVVDRMRNGPPDNRDEDVID